MRQTIWTVGHSNRSVEGFLEIIAAQEIQAVADVRRFPGSRRYPHFSSPVFAESLAAKGTDYHHLESLGGRRKRSSESSPNTAWHVESFNAYADYTLTDEFQTGLHQLMEIGKSRRTVIMCSEAVPWRCHRRIIADVLVARGWEVIDLLSVGQARPHEMTQFAIVEQGRVTYPGGTLF